MLYHLAREMALNSKSKLITGAAQKRRGTLLDIGTGTGYFAGRMKEEGWIVTGIEKSENTREYAKKKFRLDVYENSYINEIPDKSMDVITMWHVLEHIEDLNGTVGQIYRILKDDGVAVIALPNKSSVDAGYYKEDWAAYDVPRHLWHFSPENFRLLAENHNFGIVKMKPMFFDVFYISMLSEKNRKTFCGSLAGLLRGGVFFFKSLTGIDKSSSVVYILKKKK